MPNQKSLDVVTLVAPAVAITTSTNHTAVDIGATYANVGRREFKIIVGAVMTATTSATIKIEENTTSGATGWTTAGNGDSLTTISTNGSQSTHVYTNKRYLRAVTTIVGTASITPIVYALLEKRAA